MRPAYWTVRPVAVVAGASAVRDIAPQSRFDGVEHFDRLAGLLVSGIQFQGAHELLPRLAPSSAVAETPAELEVADGIRRPIGNRDSKLLDRFVPAADVGQGFAEQQPGAWVVGS